MTTEQFCYWLQGYAELNTQPPTPEQWQSIREHLQTVFKKVTPPLGIFQQDMNGIIPPASQPVDIGVPSYGPGIIC